MIKFSVRKKKMQLKMPGLKKKKKKGIPVLLKGYKNFSPLKLFIHVDTHHRLMIH